MAIEYNPNNVEVVAGVPEPVAGNLYHKQMYHDDSSIFDLTEVAATPGFEIILDFDKFRVDSDFANHFKLEVIGYYKGDSGHKKKVYIYNWITETWEAFTPAYDDFPRATVEGTYVFYSAFNVGLQEEFNGKVRIKIKHDSPGKAGNKFYVNHVKLSGIVLGVIEGAGQYSEPGWETGEDITTTTTTTTTT
jgi:hypothetical protein